MATNDILVSEGLAIGHGGNVIMTGIDFRLAPGRILAIVGPSGCGKSTLMRSLSGLDLPLGGRSEVLGLDLAVATAAEREETLRRLGFLFQGSALFSSLTLRENVELPMREFLRAPRREIRALAEYKLALVGLADAMDKMPAEISGGMAKRAAIARALALDPPLLFLDEPSAGLDPVTSAGLDQLILDLRRDLGTTFVVVTHELASILAIADRCLMLDRAAKGVIATGDPRKLRDESTHPTVRAFFHREMPEGGA